MMPNRSENTPPLPESDNRRRAGRLPLEALSCELGPIEDLSQTGMRVRSWRRLPVPELMLTLRGYDSYEPLRVACRVTWIRRDGIFRYELGFQFMNVTPALVRRLTALASAHRQRCVLK